MKPYWSDESIALYHGDWRDHLREIAALEADLIVTDPPYGETRFEWDVWPDLWPMFAVDLAPAMWCFGSMRMFLDRREDFCGWRFSQDVVWEKHNGSNLHADRFSRVHEHAVFWYQGPWASRYHKTEKPAPLLEPLISYGCPPGGLVLDLFAGSCSTAVAARATGRRAVCFEVRESQCEAAAKRLDAGMLDFTEGL